jgi:hypothetical protein
MHSWGRDLDDNGGGRLVGAEEGVEAASVLLIAINLCSNPSVEAASVMHKGQLSDRGLVSSFIHKNIRLPKQRCT